MQTVAAAALSELSKLDASALPSEIRLFKFGENRTSKGVFVLDEKGAQAVLEAHAKHGVGLHFDYEHDQRKAAAWFDLEVRNGDGLYATNIRWTPPGAELLKNREYRYASPTFMVDGDKRITRLVNVALTNLPATEHAPELVAASERVDLAQWTAAYMDTLPDSSFLYVAPGGKKDGEGKTVPRSLRHFPVKDANGKVDLPHVRNALARIPDSNVPSDVKARATAEAKRLLGETHKAKEAVNMSNLSTVVGLKDDASEDQVTERVIALAHLERRILEATGAETIADAMVVVLSAKDSAGELQQLKATVRKWEERHASEAEAEKTRQIDGAIHTALLERRVSLKDTERLARWRKHGEDFGVDSLRKLIAERDPAPVRLYQAPAPRDAVKALEMAMDRWLQQNPGKSKADAYMALSQSSPSIFGDDGVAVEE